MKKITGLLACLSLCSVLLTGCESKLEQARSQELEQLRTHDYTVFNYYGAGLDSSDEDRLLVNSDADYEFLISKCLGLDEFCESCRKIGKGHETEGSVYFDCSCGEIKDVRSWDRDTVIKVKKWLVTLAIYVPYEATLKIDGVEIPTKMDFTLKDGQEYDNQRAMGCFIDVPWAKEYEVTLPSGEVRKGTFNLSDDIQTKQHSSCLILGFDDPNDPVYE